MTNYSSNQIDTDQQIGVVVHKTYHYQVEWDSKHARIYDLEVPSRERPNAYTLADLTMRLQDLEYIAHPLPASNATGIEEGVLTFQTSSFKAPVGKLLGDSIDRLVELSIENEPGIFSNYGVGFIDKTTDERYKELYIVGDSRIVCVNDIVEVNAAGAALVNTYKDDDSGGFYLVGSIPMRFFHRTLSIVTPDLIGLNHKKSPSKDQG